MRWETFPVARISNIRMFNFYKSTFLRKIIPPSGIEPELTAPEAVALSVTPRGQLDTFTFGIDKLSRKIRLVNSFEYRDANRQIKRLTNDAQNLFSPIA